MMRRNMPRNRLSWIFILILIAEIPIQALGAQATYSPIPKTYSGPAEPAAAEALAEPSRGILPSLGRLGIVSAGALPLMVFYTDFAFDLGRFFLNGLDVAYAPWPFKNQYSETVATSERFLRLGVAAGLSLAVGLVDLAVLSRR